MKTEEFLKTIQSQYIKDPFGVSGFAFWKIEEQISKAATFQMSTSKIGECLYAVTNEKLVFYWTDNDRPFMIPLSELREFKLLSLHNRYEDVISNLKETHNINAYSPHSYATGSNGNEKENDKIRIATLNRKNTNNLSEAANIINESTNGNLTSQSIEAWTESRVYCPDLWIGAIDKKTNQLIGVGISTYNPSVMETDLDWFYVRKDYQGCRVGTMLVQETISRCRKNLA